MYWKLVSVLVALVLFTSINNDVLSESPKEKYDAVLREYESAVAAWSERFNLPKEQIDFIERYRDWPGWSYAPQFLEIGKTGGSDAAAFDALAQVVKLGVSPADSELMPIYEQSLELLLQYHIRNQGLRPLCENVRRDMTVSSERFLHRLLEESSDRELRGTACFCLGTLLTYKRELIQTKPWLLHPPQSPQEYIATRCMPGLARFLADSDAEALYDEASSYLNRTISEFGDVRTGLGGNLGASAESWLHALQNCSIGRTGPEIEGNDLNGRPMKLSEHRGKVVLLVYWATWCGPCIARVPHEREIVERYKGEPFVLLGVNGDQDHEKAKQAIEQHRINWRSWWDSWDGSTAGPIALAYGVSSLPTTILIDGHGIVRYEKLSGRQLERGVEKLLSELRSTDVQAID